MEDIRAYGLKQPIAIIPNGINLPKTTKKYVKPDSNYHLLYLGRLHPKKGIDILLQAIATLKKENPNIFNNWIIDIVGWDHENCQNKTGAYSPFQQFKRDCNIPWRIVWRR